MALDVPAVNRNGIGFTKAVLIVIMDLSNTLVPITMGWILYGVIFVSFRIRKINFTPSA
jgi:hypothetical protein